MSISTTVVTDADAFLSLRDRWEDLFVASEASVFQSWQWCYDWWLFFGRGKRLAIVIQLDGEVPMAIAPLYVSNFHGPIPSRTAAFIGTGSIDDGGFLVRPGIGGEQLSTFFDAVSAVAVDSCLDLHQVDIALAASADFQSFLEANGSAKAGIQRELMILAQEPCFRLSLTDVLPELTHLSKKFRGNLSYASRRLRRDHEVVFELVTKAEDLPAAMGDFFTLHSSRWRRRHMPGVFFSARRRRFHLQLAADLLACGRLALCFLRVDGQRLATIYAFRDHHSVYYYQGGFDPDWSRHSLAALLLKELILWARAEGLGCFDFLRGNEPYKLRWGAVEEPRYRLLACPPSFRPRMAAKLLKLENRAMIKAKELALGS